MDMNVLMVLVGLVAIAVGLTVLVSWRDRDRRKHRTDLLTAHERATTQPPALGSTALGWSDGGTRSPGRSRGY